jgi:hypothetical protein
MDNTLKVYTLEEVKDGLVNNKDLFNLVLHLERMLSIAKSLPSEQQGSFLIKELNKLLNETD